MMARIGAVSWLLPLLAMLACAPAKPPAGSDYDLVYVDEEMTRGEYGRSVRQLLNDGRFDRLDAMADSIDRTGGHWPSGRSLIDSFFDRGFGEVDDEDSPEAWRAHIQQIRQWMDARPESHAARYALAEALIGRGWAARGTGWASGVSKQEWRRFERGLEEAGRVLRQMPESAQDAYEWRMAMLQVLHGTGEDSDYRTLARASVQRYPYESRLYTHMAMHLLPRWYGEPGDWEAFADEATAALPDSISDEIYARIVTVQARYFTNVFEESEGLSWPRTKRGLLAWQRRWPASTQPRSAAALLGWMAGDRDFAHASFESLRDTFDTEVWRMKPRYDYARKWALQGSS